MAAKCVQAKISRTKETQASWHHYSPFLTSPVVVPNLCRATPFHSPVLWLGVDLSSQQDGAGEGHQGDVLRAMWGRDGDLHTHTHTRPLLMCPGVWGSPCILDAYTLIHEGPCPQLASGSRAVVSHALRSLAGGAFCVRRQYINSWQSWLSMVC